MLLTAILIIVLYSLICQTVSVNRRILVITALVAYICISYCDLYYLENFLHISFHPSDSSAYYEQTVDLHFTEVLQIESSNTFYYIINWIYNHIYNDTTFISLLVKTNNAFVILIAYLLLTRYLKNVTFLDYTLLFHPYLLLTIIRNVRDGYIILFVVIILIGIHTFPRNDIAKKYLISSLFLLSITRIILFVPLILVWILKRKKMRIPFLLLAVLIMLIFKDAIISKIVNQTIGALNYIGEDITEYMPLLEGNYSFPIIVSLIKRLFIGLISFLFTPHPISYVINWFNEMKEYGCYNIYTGIDNLLIEIGAIYSYVLVLPLSIYYYLNRKQMNIYLFLFVTLYIIIYVLAYIGVSDIRNRFFAFFFILSGLIIKAESSHPIFYKWKYVGASICICVLILVFTAKI